MTPALVGAMPTFGLRVLWDDLELRLPDDAELVGLGDLAASGVHGPDAYSWPWTRGSKDEVRRNVLTHQWSNRARTATDDWVLSLGVFRNGEIVGVQQLSAKGFPVARSVRTGSWLGLRHQGRGIGTRMRFAALHLAFEGLDAAEMRSEAYDDNAASNAVSRRLGYEANGCRIIARDEHPAVENSYRMTREVWKNRPADARPDIRLDGLAPVRGLFGIDQPDRSGAARG